MNWRLTFCFLFVSIGITTSSWAVGIGIYGTGNVDFMTWKYHVEESNTTGFSYGGGIVIDTNVAKDQLFDYRFTGGYEQYMLKNPYSDYYGRWIHRFSMTHTFGFGLVRNNDLRFWVGPRLGLHYYYKKDMYSNLDGIGSDLLFAFGLNINAGDIMTFFIDFGFGYMGIYNIRGLHANGNAFGADGKIGFIFRINDSFARVEKPIEENRNK